MPELDLTGALDVRIAGQDAREIRIAAQTIWTRPPFTAAGFFAGGIAGFLHEGQDGRSWQDTAATIAAAVGDPVARRDDETANGTHGTQATFAAQPLREADGESFNGVSNVLTTPFDIRRPAMTWAARVKRVGNGTFLGARRNFAGSPRELGFTSGALRFLRGNAGTWTGPVVDTDWHVIAASFASPTWRIFVDGVEVGTFDAGQDGQPLGIGACWRSDTNTSTNFFGGVIAQRLAIARTLTPGEIGLLNGWMG